MSAMVMLPGEGPEQHRMREDAAVGLGAILPVLLLIAGGVLLLRAPAAALF